MVSVFFGIQAPYGMKRDRNVKMEHTKISTDIEQNIKQFQQLFADSADIKMKEMRLGKGKKRRCFLAYIEVAVSNMLLETTALGDCWRHYRSCRTET